MPLAEDSSGDLFLIDFFTLPPLPGKVEVALGPPLVAPTASDDVLGQGKWQTGPAVAIVAPPSWGLVGSLIQYQQSLPEIGSARMSSC